VTRTRSTALAIAFLALAAGGIAWLVAHGDGGRSAGALAERRDSPLTDQSAEATVSQPAPQIELERTPAAETAAALIRVLVVRAIDQSPVEGAECRLLPLELSAEWSGRLVSSSRAGVGESTKTGSDGRCELEAAPDSEHELQVLIPSQDSYSQIVPPLPAGEATEMVVEIRYALDLDFHGLVVDDATSEPVAGASIRGEEERADVNLVTDAFGRFALRVTSWEEARANATALGYARRMFRLGTDHENQANSLVVRLIRSATLRVSVIDAEAKALARAGLTVSTDLQHGVQTEGTMGFLGPHEEPTWKTISDMTGMATFADLPSGAPLTVVAYSGALSRKFPSSLELEPGEVRDLQVRLGGGALIRGSLVEANGQPIAGHEVWCLSGDRQHDGPIQSFQEHELSARATTDERGQFELDDMAPATWWLAPAPSLDRRDEGETILPLAQPVVVDAEAQVVDVVLRVERGSYVRGLVVDETDDGVAGARVRASSRGEPRFWANATADSQGRFMVGPLPPGRYEVAATAYGRFAGSLPIEVQADATDLVLRLREGGVVLGVVVDGTTGKTCDAEVELTRADSEQRQSWNTQTRAGEFEFGRLAPGVYDIGARTRDAQFGFRTALSVQANQIIEDVRLVVSPGGTLRLRYEGANEQVRCYVFVHGLHVAIENLTRGETVECAVPAAELEVVMRERGSDSEDKQVVTVTTGAAVDLVLGKSP
jgi:hypothetical protein